MFWHYVTYITCLDAAVTDPGNNLVRSVSPFRQLTNPPISLRLLPAHGITIHGKEIVPNFVEFEVSDSPDLLVE